jgi:ribose/xylose/arabinose/galactoside ABC-type transport system permease subunit
MKELTFLQRFRGSKMFALVLLFAVMLVVLIPWGQFSGKIDYGRSGVFVQEFATILDNMVVTGFLVVGAAFLMVSGNIDLSASKIGALGGVVVARSLAASYWNLPWWLAILVTLAICAGVGALNAVLVNEFRFQPFIATMAMASVANGVLYLFAKNPEGLSQPIPIDLAVHPVISWMVNYKLFGLIPFTALLLIAVFIIYGVILSSTRFGMKIYIVGGNPMAANLVGVNPKLISYILFANSGMLGGLAGIILAFRTRNAVLLALQTNMFTGLTAAMLGGISFGGGSGGMGGAFFGMFVLQTFNKLILNVPISKYWATTFSGVLLIVALAIDFFSQRRLLKGGK